MKFLLLIPAILLSATAAHSQTNTPTSSTTRTPAMRASVQSPHSQDDIQWGPAPPVLPAGAQIAVLQGNPFGAGVYTLRLKMPAGYTVPPHFHPTDEMVTVISGSLRFGMGDAIDRSATTLMHAGSFMTAEQGKHHYVVAQGATIVQVHGMGPFAITYVQTGTSTPPASSAP